jgi:beta-glucosidase
MRDIKAMIKEMTLEEKASLCSGSDFWHTKALERLGIPKVMLSDGPHGVRKQEGEGDHLGLGQSISATCFPAACAAAASFDVDLVQSTGETLGQECQAEDLSVLLGPASNIKRSPLCGRNFEYYSEDPYLTGKLSAAHIRGVQKWDVGTSMKHFACNNQEYKRMSCSSEVDERTLREIYLTGFEIAVKESQPKTIMCSYNKVNGTFASENKKLLTDILRDEWGFEGYVVTDWGAVADRVEGIRAGLDLEMPGSNGENDALIVAAVKKGELDESLVDQAVENILKVTFSYLDHRHPEAVYDRQADHAKAIAAAKECAVLLENNGVLPLKTEQKVAYIGEFAKKPRFQGGGSSHINCSHISAAYDASMEKQRNITYAQGFAADGDVYDETLAKEAIAAAKAADAAVIFAGLPDSFESEGFDRDHMQIPSCQNRLIAEIAAVQPNTVVVLHNGAPVECPWADRAAAILEMYLGGQGVGAATDALLYGEANPSGRLAETFPYHLEDNPSFLYYKGDGLTTEYNEGIYVGYRYYEKKKMPVRWAFGHGLSYTEFTYSNLRLSSTTMKDEDKITVSVDVTNAGHVTGKEVVQLYVSDRTGTFGRPVKELKGFAKVELAPGETRTITLELCYRSLAYYHTGLGDWYAKSGTYGILVGHASDDIRLETELQFETAKLLPFTVDKATTIGQLMADPRTGAAITQMVQQLSARSDAKKQAEEQSESDAKMVQEMMLGMPLKSLVSYGIMTDEQVGGLIASMNQAIENYV